MPYSVRRDDHRIDMDEVQKLAQSTGRRSSSPAARLIRVFDFRRFREIADEAGAKLLVDMHFAGSRGRRRASQSVPARPCRDLDRAQELRGPRSGFILSNDEELAKKINSAVFPACRAAC